MHDTEDRITDIIIVVIILAVIILKILNVITSSWFWLLSPIWLLCGIGIILSVAFGIAFIIATINMTKEKDNEKEERY